MSEQNFNEQMLDNYLFETVQNIEQLEASILLSEKALSFSQESINEIFRIMHTIKGSSAMMLFNNISILAHSIEDLFYFLRESKLKNIDYSSLSDLLLEGVDFIKSEEAVGGSIEIASIAGAGSTVTLKIPLTLAIIEGMNFLVGNTHYTLPINSITESFRPNKKDIITDPEGNEMIMVRGQCYPILRIHKHFGIKSCTTDITQGILIIVEHGGKSLCLFADILLGQQQIVVKALPSYIKNKGNLEGLTGCTLLGDGSISLIIDVNKLINAVSTVKQTN